jgi:hypothetical protein
VADHPRVFLAGISLWFYAGIPLWFYEGIPLYIPKPVLQNQ